MKYREEIDGLRAIAILPVILFHAGFEIFGGGFIGVDVFFVISGYLITNIITSELGTGNFSIINFYERRARRIMPALFTVMTASLLAGYHLLMPDEFKNLGQSLVATSIFSNNILLAITSGYWDLASEFKPLLHTWSLGVEEQYYLVMPFILLLAWKYCKNKIPFLLTILFISSLITSFLLFSESSKWAFYILPTRAWEIIMGALAAIFLQYKHQNTFDLRISNIISSLGLILVTFSIFTYNKSTPLPGINLLIPTIGATLIIIFSKEKTLVNKLLKNKLLVFCGLLSYSLYLWHQPVFSYIRAYSINKPTSVEFLIAIFFVFLLSYFTWKYIESPFRRKSFINKKNTFIFSIIGSSIFIATGFILNKNYGLPNRVFDTNIKIEDMDKRIYNERIFRLKMNSFIQDTRSNILIIGNSFARDFTNITLETYDTKKTEIIYRDDITQCIFPYKDFLSEELFSKAKIIVFSSGSVDKDCLFSDLEFAKINNKKIYYIGTKDFGYNLNWIIQLDKNSRARKYNKIPESTLKIDAEMSKIIPEENYISLINPINISGKIPITDEFGRMISTDRTHLTKYGAIYFGQKVVKNSSYSDIFK